MNTFPASQHFTAHGKLLLSGEYFVLDGAVALALPTSPTQSLEIILKEKGDPKLHWLSLDEQNLPWFEATFTIPALQIVQSSDQEIATQLKDILLAAKQQSPDFLSKNLPIEATTLLGFPRNWGLGTSSTLIYNIGQWSKTDPFKLLFASMGGSGYDIACAAAQRPILYRLENGTPWYERCNFNPPFLDNLFFIYLDKKQNSRKGIARYRQHADSKTGCDDISALSYEMLNAKSLAAFQLLMQQHEKIVSAAIGLPPIQQERFADFPGAIKSLGAWGGDFIMAASEETASVIQRYFKQKTFSTFLTYSELIKQD